MSNTVISVENLSKAYRLGQIGTGTLSHDLNAWWAKVGGKPNPLLRIGEKEHRNRDSESIWALRDVNFQVEQGEVLGIIGRNGAGKSTLLKILSRVTAPTSGKVKVKGRIASLLEVGTGFHPDLTGRENTYLNGAILGMSRKEIDRKFDEIVDFAEIEQFIDTPVKRYSSGMYVRLAFAIAGHLVPEILAVDEVLAVGDAAFQKKCLGKMGDAAKSGRTVLFVSHNIGQMRNLCQRGLVLDKGNIFYDGEISQAIAKYYGMSATRFSNEEKTYGFLEWKFTNTNQPHVIDTMGILDLEIGINLNRSLSRASLILKLQTGDGQTICGWWFPSVQLSKGTHQLTFQMPNLPLAAGTYYWYAGMWDPSKKVDEQVFSQEVIVTTEDFSRFPPQHPHLLNMDCIFSVDGVKMAS